MDNTFRNIASVVFTMVLMLTMGCEKEIPFNAEVSKPKIVVNDDFNPNTSWAVNISNSRSVVDNGSLHSIENATVSIFENGVFVESLNEDSLNPGIYHGNTLPSEGQTYRIEVEAPDYEAVFSESTIPYNQLSLNNVDTTFINEGPNYRRLKLSLDVQDGSSDENYYGISILAEYVDEENGTTNIRPLFMSNSGILNGGNDEFYDQYLLFDDGLFNETSYTIQVDIAGIDEVVYEGIDDEGNDVFRSIPPNKLFFSLYTYSEELYLFKRSVNQYYDSDGDPFAQPVQVYTNVNGGFGLFGGFNEFIVAYDM